MVGAWSLRRGVEEGAVWAFIAGVVLDLLSAGPATSLLFALLAASLVLGIDPSTGGARRQTPSFGDNPLALIVGVVIGTLVFHLVLLTAMQLAGYSLNWLDAAPRVVLPRMIFNLVLMPFVYHALGWLDRRSRREELVL